MSSASFDEAIEIGAKPARIDGRDVRPPAEQCRRPYRARRQGTQFGNRASVARDREPLAGLHAIDHFTPVVAEVTDRDLFDHGRPMMWVDHRLADLKSHV